MKKNYKDYLDKLLAQIETYKFTVKKLEQLFREDEAQLKKGGDYLNLEAIHIRDWDNFSDKDWLIDYRRISIFGKEEYLKELNEIKSSIYKHYLIEVYESLIKYIGLLRGHKIKRALKIHEIVPILETTFHNKKTPFGFNTITFLYIFCQVRNTFTHSDSIFKIENIDITRKEYLKHFDIDQSKCRQFLNTYFATNINTNSSSVRLVTTQGIFDLIIKFTQSYAFSLFKFYSEKENLPWEIQKEKEKFDIKTGKHLTDEQKKHLLSLVRASK